MHKYFKIIILISAVLIIGGLYRIYKLDSFHSNNIILKTTDFTPLSKESKLPLSLKIKGQEKNQNTHEVQNEANLEHLKVFDKLEQDWIIKVEEIIGSEKINLYLELRKRSEADKLKAYTDYHKYLREKYGDQFSYNFSDDTSLAEKKINQIYLKKLLEIIGPAKFKDYTEARDRINEEMRRSNHENFQIEF